MRRLVPVCLLCSLVAIGGCSGGSGSPGASSSSAVTTAASPPASPSAPTTVTATPSTTATVTPPLVISPTSRPSAVGECPSSALGLSTGRGGAAAGTYYLPLIFTNTSGSACAMRGYPGASFLDASGQQIGPSADRSKGEPAHRVVLASGAKAHALLGIPDSANFSGSACRPRKTASIRAYPPDQTQPLEVHITLTVCTTKNGRALIQPIKPGTHG